MVLPSPSHAVAGSDTVAVLRRMQCHYNPAWLNGCALTRVDELPQPLLALAFPGLRIEGR